MEACDFHCENLLAAGEYPMLLDLEAVFHPSVVPAAMNDAIHVAERTMGYSVMKVGLLPQKFWISQENAGIDISGFGGEAGQSGPRKAPFWENAATDQMRLARRHTYQNLPTLHGDKISALHYAEPLTEGFRAAYRLLLGHRDEFLSHIAKFANDEIRVIARATRVYATLLHESFHPDVLRSEADRDALFDGLHAATPDCPMLATLVPSERRDLWKGDIPFFLTRPRSRSL